MNAPQMIEIDETDERIIELLREDGRRPYRAMALALGLTEATVRTRVRRLEERNAMRVVAVTDFQAAGYDLMLAIGIQVDERTPLEVAEDLARVPEVFSINLVIGNCDIEVLVVAEDQTALAELIYQRLATVPGVLRVVPALAVDVLKNQPDWVPLSTKTARATASSGGGGASLPGAVNSSTANHRAGTSLGGAVYKTAQEPVSKESGGALSRGAKADRAAQEPASRESEGAL